MRSGEPTSFNSFGARESKDPKVEELALELLKEAEGLWEKRSEGKIPTQLIIAWLKRVENEYFPAYKNAGEKLNGISWMTGTPLGSRYITLMREALNSDLGQFPNPSHS